MIPRRNRLDKNEPAELAIRNAVNEVERIGADNRLTEAINHLNHARELVADFIEEKLIPHTNQQPPTKQ